MLSMRKTPFTILQLLSLFIAACTGTAPPETVASTPVEDLPISIQSSASDAVPTPVPQSIIDEADAEYLLLANLYERVTPAVVNIEVDVQNPITGTFDFSRGSGFVYDIQGNIITNAHVVSDAIAIRVTFNDGFVAEAQLVGADNYSDLAVVRVQVDLERLLPLRLTDSDRVRPGQRAVAIGNPFGLSSSMSVGIVSAVGRSLRSAELINADVAPGFENPSIIQMDTPINPGNSGGPLLTSSGDVMGVTTAIRSESGVFQGVGFAVPANTVKRVVPDLIEKGRVDYSWIGISVLPEDNGFGVAGLVDPLGLPVDSGVLIRAITVDSPADKAGLQGGHTVTEVRGTPVCAGGDIIAAVNGQFINNMDELVAYLVMNTRPGDTVNMLIVRDRESFEIPLRLEQRPQTERSDVRDCNS